MAQHKGRLSAQQRYLSKEELTEICRLAKEEEMKPSLIAEKLGISYSRAYRILKEFRKQGIEFGYLGQRQANLKQLIKEIVEGK